jgi:hypothetical protein
MRLCLMQLAASPSEHADFLTCPRCGMQMPKVVTIAPIGRQPGLVAFECQNACIGPLRGVRRRDKGAFMAAPGP